MELFSSFRYAIFGEIILLANVKICTFSVSLSSKFDEREDPSVLRNYGNLLVEICGVVPDGVVVFFTSYSYLENVVSMWNETGIIEGIQKNKIIFCESSDITETSQALSKPRF